MMCVAPWDTLDACRIFEGSGIAGLHIDIMDGSFVPNFTLGVDYCKSLGRVTSLPLDLHLMIDSPEDKLGWFPIRPGDIVSVHVESTRHLDRTVSLIKDRGGIPFAALNPATPMNAIIEVLPELGGILVMTVNPGFAGQKLVGYTVGKVARLRKFLDERGLGGLPIEVDGNISAENLSRLKKAGADRFVIGTSGFLREPVSERTVEEIEMFERI